MESSRPTYQHTKVIDLTFSIIASALIDRGGMTKGMSVEDVIKGLKFAGIRKEISSNGYEHAKYLETCGWNNITAEDVMVLDNIGDYQNNALEIVTREWVTTNNIAPNFPSGALVRAPITRDVGTYSSVIRHEVITGRAYYQENHRKTARCLLRDHDWIERNGDQGGYLINWEDVIDILETAPAS